jgi:hypothetical protein
MSKGRLKNIFRRLKIFNLYERTKHDPSRTKKPFERHKARDVRQGGYEKWLMIVGPDGKIEAIHKLNPGATGIKQTVKP